ncbi:unnamed protein product [Chironomus riparius]|uniref:Uncharacterized protein n=1 Tax=Chironomus riparius TaxID=315576 RepID=A0A9N9WR70_9DIPT|nr:unnamed protein product [Chironomus riparius]
MFWKKEFLVFLVFVTSTKFATSQKVCKSKVCQLEAENMKSKIDDSVSPCDDFYQYACGNYNPDIPDDKSEANVFNVLQDLLDEQLNEGMSEESSDRDINPLRVVKNYYQACMDKETINKIGLKHVVEKMVYLGGWPVVKSHNWDESSWRYQKFVQTAELLGFPQNYLFGFGLIQDLKNDTRRILVLDQPGLGLSREFLIKGLNESLVQAYHSFQVDLAVLYGADKEDSEKDMKDVLDFEIAFAKITQSKEERRDVTKLYNLITVSELQMMSPCLHWLNYMNAFLPKDKQIDKSEVLMITSKQVFIDIHKLLTSTPQRTIANYVMWRIALSTSSLLSDDIRERRLQYTKKLTGVEKYKPRWKECVSWTSNYLSIASSALYVRKYFNEKSKHDALELVDRIKEEFRTTLKTIEWMDEKTRVAAIEKALKMTNFIGYPDELNDDKKLIEYYEDLEINNKEFFKSFLKLNRFSSKKDLVKFREIVNKTAWEDHAEVALVNAFYSPIENSIQFPAGILQGQMFSADRPKYMNYGSIGFVIGHEVTHGFDDQGSRFDGNGNLVDWWAKDTKNAYLEKAQCIVYQYGNYTEPTTNLKLNGVHTQGENIADNGGLLVSYKAYQNWIKENKQELALPDLELSPMQLFWMSAAQTWCSKTRPETMKLRIATDTHSPPLFRVNGVVSNTVEFLNDFKCPETSAMNRKNKCKVW